jgi:ubiquinone/menaquinone biosynthesis C-methylase UbiE/DNA-binding transcriptional ArsR family regulator
MQRLLSSLAAAADPTRLRLLALCARGAFCVNDFCEILGQSQPRLSRHLRLLCEAGLLERTREGANAWFALAQGDSGALSRDILRRLPEPDPLLAADRRGAARVLAERARAASEKFRQRGADWDEMRALDLPAEAVEDALVGLLPSGPLGHALDIGTGTGQLLESLAPRISSGLGIDASRTMLALARVRLASSDFAHCAVRLADMYALPLPDAAFDLVFLQMVLHYAEEPEAAIAEARRVLAPGGRLIVVDLAPHDRVGLVEQMAHRRLGFSDAFMETLFNDAGLAARPPLTVSGPAGRNPSLGVRIWQAIAPQIVSSPAGKVFA